MMHKVLLALACSFALCDARRVQVQSSLSHLQASPALQVAQKVSASPPGSVHAQSANGHWQKVHNKNWQPAKIFFGVVGGMMLLVPLAFWMAQLLFKQLDKIAEPMITEEANEVSQAPDPRLIQGSASVDQ
mmetsp:Transcript_24217/g.38725  ORF Transcript_24217/g.38725 Transcript_24217/m.38725 type:complete len:131 (+) Transcript_24217:86-478(+)